ncbi:MAG: pyridoxamine 5'-phosphate oxidase family protein [Firmicutes bacterium]|nr:pyridoxamine 5'-phosphate oxidase family protein [Bacillota bacterium]
MDANALEIMNERFGRDREIALATLDGGGPAVRTIDAVYKDGSFYAITYAESAKMKQIAINPLVAVSGEWFTGRGVGENLGWILDGNNRGIRLMLKAAFAWYGNGHVDENDRNTIILRVKLTGGVLFSQGTKYELDFAD